MCSIDNVETYVQDYKNNVKTKCFSFQIQFISFANRHTNDDDDNNDIIEYFYIHTNIHTHIFIS